jgi:hypothetical protein
VLETMASPSDEPEASADDGGFLRGVLDIQRRYWDL